jgi:hypothetical protein
MKHEINKTQDDSELSSMRKLVGCHLIHWNRKLAFGAWVGQGYENLSCEYEFMIQCHKSLISLAPFLVFLVLLTLTS